MNIINDSAILMGLKDLIQVWGAFSLALLPAMFGAKVCNQLIRTMYSKFNPKMSWTSQGSWIQAIPRGIVMLVIMLYISRALRGYEISNERDLLIFFVATVLGVYTLIMLGKKKWTLV